MNSYLWRIAIAASQLLNAIVGGRPVETLCSRMAGTQWFLPQTIERIWPGHLIGSKESSIGRAQSFINYHKEKNG